MESVYLREKDGMCTLERGLERRVYFREKDGERIL